MIDLRLKIKNRTLSSLVSQDVFEDKETSHLLNCDDLVCFIIGGTHFQSQELDLHPLIESLFMIIL